MKIIDDYKNVFLGIDTDCLPNDAQPVSGIFGQYRYEGTHMEPAGIKYMAKWWVEALLKQSETVCN